jgi:hypothetical protein
MLLRRPDAVVDLESAQPLKLWPPLLNHGFDDAQSVVTERHPIQRGEIAQRTQTDISIRSLRACARAKHQVENLLPAPYSIGAKTRLLVVYLPDRAIGPPL